MPKTSILNNKEAVAEAIAKSGSIKSALSHLGLRAAGGNYRAFNLACARHNLSIPQWDRKSQLADLAKRRTLSDNEVFVRNSTYHNRDKIKKRLFRMGVANQCSICGQLPEWNGKPLVLQLDHINGVWNDNRIANLRILCGHCHSQTTTYCGRNK